MFKLERQLDEIVDILYDKDLLLWKRIPTQNIVIFGETKYGLSHRDDNEIIFIMSVLINDGYVVLNETKWDSMKNPTYSLTTKGIILKKNGGFTWLKIKSIITNFIIIWAAIFTIIVSVSALYEAVNKNKKDYMNNDKILKPNNWVEINTVILRDSCQKPRILPSNK
jgi:large-conductance mechanosensitive channel